MIYQIIMIYQFNDMRNTFIIEFADKPLYLLLVKILLLFMLD